MSTKTAPIFKAVILSKAELVNEISSICFVSSRTAYRIINGEKKVRQIELELLHSIVIKRIEALQKAV